MMLSPVILFGLFVLVVLCGTFLLMVIAKKKWGYTEKREQELLKEPESFSDFKRNGRKAEKRRHV